jgi:hypothetical protein
MGFTLEKDIEVPTARLRYGANHASRVRCEHVLRFRRGSIGAPLTIKPDGQGGMQHSV